MEDILEEDYTGEYLIEFAQLNGKALGLPDNPWVDELAEKRKNKHHTPRIKIPGRKGVSVEDCSISLSIEAEPKIKAKSLKANISEKDLNKYKKFITDNLELLLKHWHGQISTDDLKERLYGHTLHKKYMVCSKKQNYGFILLISTFDKEPTLYMEDYNGNEITRIMLTDKPSKIEDIYIVDGCPDIDDKLKINLLEWANNSTPIGLNNWLYALQNWYSFRGE